MFLSTLSTRIDDDSEKKEREESQWDAHPPPGNRQHTAPGRARLAAIDIDPWGQLLGSFNEEIYVTQHDEVSLASPGGFQRALDDTSNCEE